VIGRNHRLIADDSPDVNVYSRGWLAILLGGTGVADILKFIRKTAADAYEVADVVALPTGGPTITSGSGTPEGVVTAPVGSLFLRTDGGASTSVYVKESGSGNTGWVAK